MSSASGCGTRLHGSTLTCPPTHWSRCVPQADAPGGRGTTEARNRDFHRMLVDGVTVERRIETTGPYAAPRCGSSISTTHEANDWLAVNQFTVTESQNKRRR